MRRNPLPRLDEADLLAEPASNALREAEVCSAPCQHSCLQSTSLLLPAPQKASLLKTLGSVIAGLGPNLSTCSPRF
jgi:hypothetical protein